MEFYSRWREFPRPLQLTRTAPVGASARLRSVASRGWRLRVRIPNPRGAPCRAFASRLLIWRASLASRGGAGRVMGMRPSKPLGHATLNPLAGKRARDFASLVKVKFSRSNCRVAKPSQSNFGGHGDSWSVSSVLLGRFCCAAFGACPRQGARAIVGLKNAGALNSTTPSEQAQFSLAYLVQPDDRLHRWCSAASRSTSRPSSTSDPRAGRWLAASGYIGADFIENTYRSRRASARRPRPRQSAGAVVSAPTRSAPPEGAHGRRR